MQKRFADPATLCALLRALANIADYRLLEMKKGHIKVLMSEDEGRQSGTQTASAVRVSNSPSRELIHQCAVSLSINTIIYCPSKVSRTVRRATSTR